MTLTTATRAQTAIMTNNALLEIDWGQAASSGLSDETYSDPNPDKKILISPKLFFNFAKSKLTKIEQKDFKQRTTKLISMLKYAQSMNQLAVYEECAKNLAIIFQEQQLLTLGVDRYIKKQDLLKFVQNVKDKVVKVKDFTEFPRVVPKNIRKVYTNLRSKEIFDEFVIAYVDYSEEEVKSTKQKIREKDPILFGKLATQPDKYYFIIDWVDEYCDLTLDQITDKLTELDNNYEVTLIEDISLREINNLKKELLLKSKSLDMTNGTNYKDLMQKENKTLGILSRFLTKIRGK